MILNENDYKQVHDTLKKTDFSGVCIHSDIFYGFKFERVLPREDLLQAHYHALKEVVEYRPVWMPAFNYDYPATKVYDIRKTPSQVGVLTEYFRESIAQWRSPVPIFSFAGEGDEPLSDSFQTIDPFDAKSLFQNMVNSNMLIMYYGTRGIYPSTIIHFSERVSEKLYYRYDKLFSGEIIHDDKRQHAVLNFHVRPKGKYLDYDWSRLEEDLLREGLLKKICGRRFEFRCIKASDIAAYWIQKIKTDPLYLLDSQSRSWVEPALEKLGRPFLLSDFE
jgi:aminoglycoside 3-N-acetyltransferase